jgi:phosphatidylserine decarboxylase
LVTRYGLDVVIAVVVIAALLLTISYFLVDWRPLKIGLSLLAISGLIFTFWFFRDPERTVPNGDGLVIAPADGRIIDIKPVDEQEFLKGEGTLISIFMSPLNVHVNRFPITGTVGYFQHFPGEYLVAYEEKASLRNERTHIGVGNSRMKVLFKQIAGFVARRIVADLKVGDPAVAGERFGMIKFGSRVDVIVPRTLDVRVQVGQNTVAGETVLAVMKP